MQWTQEQEIAIEESGKDILVAAAAGSGKTAVLVERIIRKLTRTEQPIDIDTLLVVTFTNAAAQEMRARVGEALEEALAHDPASIHLKRQLSLLQRASISTLHSFCMDVVKQYAYLLDIDPGFRIANDMEADLMKQEVLEDLFEDWYGKDEAEQEAFFAVIDRFSSDRSDAAVETLILELYTFAMQNPWPESWLDGLLNMYQLPDDWTEDELPWLGILKQAAASQLEAMMQEAAQALEVSREEGGPYHYEELLLDEYRMFEAAYAQIESWEGLRSAMDFSFASLPRKKIDCDEEKKDQVKRLRNSYKKRKETMADKWFIRDLDGHVCDMQEMAPVIGQLIVLTKEFRERYARAKREKGIVDFPDLEHFCLSLLMDGESTPDNPVPSHVAQQLRAQYTELLVDEYQDTNLVQETILYLIKDVRNQGNLFMVGDVKQSIYRFRHAEPSLFIDKYSKFQTGELPGRRIDLASNFRSRKHVLSGANYIFRQIFDEVLGEISYDADAELIYANHMYDDYPHESPEPDLLIIDREKPDEKEPDMEGENFRDLEKAQLEARAYAARIKQWIHPEEGQPLQIVDKSTGIQRDIQYRDIAILQRSMTWAPTIVDELKKQGIPVYAELSTGYFTAIEVKIMLSFLKIIDNPQQDIPLASVLRSPIVGLDEEELARIRLADRHGSYYDALLAFDAGGEDATVEKIGRFMEQLGRFRLAARQGALSELIWDIYRVTGYYDFVGGMPGGRQRQANLRALYDRARTYETTSFRGLFRFLRFIETMEERGDDLGAARALSEQEDVVRLMTIHKSKGLEFPVVILGGMDKQFNMQDLHKRYLLHKDLGFSSKYVDPIKRITYPTLFHHAMEEEKKQELLAEEMRVLYVALTRAKEKLVMVGTVRSFEKKRESWEQALEHPEWVLPVYQRMEAKSYLDWVGPALIRHAENGILRNGNDSTLVPEEIAYDPSDWHVEVIHGSDLADMEQDAAQKDAVLHEMITEWKPFYLEDSQLAEKVDRRLSYRYPYPQAAFSRAKQSVTELKRQRELQDEYSADNLRTSSSKPIFNRPQFLQDEKSVSPADIGTAVHTVMQHIPFTDVMDKDAIDRLTDTLVAREILTRAEGDMVDTEMIHNFLKSDMAQYMMRQERLYREIPFSLALKAKDVYADWDEEEDEHVLIQGVIDCIIPSAEGWLILDYKTDAIDEEVTDRLRKKLTERYETQINLYKHAIETIWKEPVAGAYLYFFQQQLLIDL